MTDAIEIVRELLRSQLQLGDRADLLDENSTIIGAIPEFDSVAVVGIVTHLEDELGLEIDDDEITGEIFETVGSLARFIADKL